jgi:regulator of RNase E activity RraA
MDTTELLDILRQHGTGPVSDALDLLGHDGGLQGLVRTSGTEVVAGPAFTLQYEPVEPGRFAPAGDFIDDVPPGAVVTIANHGRTYCTVWGGILTMVARRNGIAGTVIDGCCRDLGDIWSLDYALWSRGSYMKSGKNRVLLTAVQTAVILCGTCVAPGDIVCADDAGVVVVPRALTGQVAEHVQQIVAMEAAVQADIAQGLALRATRKRHGSNKVGLAWQTRTGAAAPDPTKR